ncbi:nitroreductase family protein [Candidatus Bipolaricaulota bacterium]
MNPTLQTLQDLRSTHGNFTEQQVSNEDLETILKTASRAANASNRQSYSIVIVDNQDQMRELTGYRGSRLLIFCVDFNRLIDTAAQLGREYNVRGFAPFLTGAVDAALAAQTAVIAATSLGIDSLFSNGIHRGDIRRIYDSLRLPKRHCFPLIALVLGYADAEPGKLRGRLTGPGVIHHGEYTRATSEELAEIIAQCDDPETGLGLNIPWKEKGFDHFLEWFFDVWSKRFPTSEGRTQLFEQLVNAGFVEGELDA